MSLHLRSPRRASICSCEPLESRRLLSGRVVAYFPEYRYASTFNKIDWDAITHINYFSIFANSNGSLNTGDVTPSRLQNAVAAAHANGDKISIVVGPQDLGAMAGNATARAAFVTNILDYCNTYNLDGVDIDWEPKPTGSNVTNFTSLVNALHAQLNPQGLLITAAVYPLTPNIPVTTVAKMDWLNVMGYNFRYDDHTNFTDTVTSLNQWTNWGVPKDKIVMGTGFYGKRGTSWDPGMHQSLSYATIINNYLAANSTYPPPGQDLIDTWYTAGPDTTRAKAEYIRENGYGGMMIWELGHDHYDAAGQFTPASLLPVIASELLDTTAPATESAEFLYATAPHKITFQFTENVSASLQTSDLTVRDVNTQATILVSNVTWDAATSTATFSLNNAVPDGSYQATLSGAGVSDAAGNTMGGDVVFDFSFLRGDANGDGNVNLTDFNILASNFGQSGKDFTQGNFDYDPAGSVNLTDFNILAARFGQSVGASLGTTASAGRKLFSLTAIAPVTRPARVMDALRDDVLA